ncbi:MAG: ABC transporter substrate-binding protein [Nitrospirae bacterium]|nr:ABC transporter substrate-binding protein [Nitrospirota bacterium]
MFDSYKIICTAISIITMLCLSCKDKDISAERERRAKKAKGDITIAVAGSWDKLKGNADMYNGVELAVEEINKTNILNGRKIHLIAKGDSADLNKARLVASEIVNNADITAVIGHSFGFITSSAAEIYTRGGLLLIAPCQYIPEKAKDAGQMEFSFMPRPDSISEMFVKYMQKMKYKTVVIAYVKGPSSIKILNSFYNAGEGRIKIVDSVPFNINDVVSFKNIVKKWTHLEFDAILFIAPPYYLDNLLMDLRDNNMKMPILVTAEPMLLSNAPEMKERLSDEVFLLTCNHDNKSNELKQFISEFNNKYKYQPNHVAINAYDAVKVLANAWASVGTAQPIKTAQEMSKMKAINGLCGTYSFDESGLLNTSQMYLVRVRDGKIEHINDDSR